MKNEDVLIKDGMRLDGRKFDELRKIEMKVGVLTSKSFWGKTKN